MFRKISHVLIIAVVSILLIVQPTYAKGDPPPEYDATIIGPNGEIYYVDVFEVVSVDTNSANAPQPEASGCNAVIYGVNYYNAFGVNVLRFSERVSWCYNGTKITSVSHTHTPAVYSPIYRYNGLIAHAHSGGVNQSSFRAYAQASFCEFVPPNGACFWYVYPWVDITVYGNGYYVGGAGY